MDRSGKIAGLWSARVLVAVALLALPFTALAEDHGDCPTCNPDLQLRETVHADAPVRNADGTETTNFTITLRINTTPFSTRVANMAEDLADAALGIIGLSLADFQGGSTDNLVSPDGNLRVVKTYYIPVAGYEKLKPETVDAHMYVMFGQKFKKLAKADAAAREIAEGGIKSCDKNAVLHAISELNVVLEAYRERLTHARDIKGMNEHQLAYFASEINYLLNPSDDPRYVGAIPVPWNQGVGVTLDKYFGIEVSRSRYLAEMQPILIGPGAGFAGQSDEYEPILDEVERRRDAISALEAKVAAITPFLEANIAVVSTNIARLKAIADGM